ncbi:hypothetical protein HJFPF1_01542 [Paramyrothecium foliicola]|nr:hypothetical protein HJFPF1_01542 [Paramyrothecium foliicola]
MRWQTLTHQRKMRTAPVAVAVACLLGSTAAAPASTTYLVARDVEHMDSMNLVQPPASRVSTGELSAADVQGSHSGPEFASMKLEDLFRSLLKKRDEAMMGANMMETVKKDIVAQLQSRLLAVLGEGNEEKRQQLENVLQRIVDEATKPKQEAMKRSEAAEMAELPSPVSGPVGDLLGVLGLNGGDGSSEGQTLGGVIDSILDTLGLSGNGKGLLGALLGGPDRPAPTPGTTQTGAKPSSTAKPGDSLLPFLGLGPYLGTGGNGLGGLFGGLSTSSQSGPSTSGQSFDGITTGGGPFGSLVNPLPAFIPGALSALGFAARKRENAATERSEMTADAMEEVAAAVHVQMTNEAKMVGGVVETNEDGVMAEAADTLMVRADKDKDTSKDSKATEDDKDNKGDEDEAEEVDETENQGEDEDEYEEQGQNVEEDDSSRSGIIVGPRLTHVAEVIDKDLDEVSFALNAIGSAIPELLEATQDLEDAIAAFREAADGLASLAGLNDDDED